MRWWQTGDPLTPYRVKRTCTADGCDRPHHARGLCQTHYRPKTQAVARKRAELIEDLLDLLDTDTPSTIARRLGYTRPASLARRLERAGRIDPATTAHLQAAAGHLAAAGRELLAVLGRTAAPGPTAPGPTPTGQTSTDDPPRPSDPDDVPGAGWTRIDVSTGPIDEEHS